MKKENQQRSAVPLAKSFRGKVDLLVLLAIVVSVVLILAATVPAAQSRLQGTVKNYMLDMAKAYGASLDEEITYNGEDKILNAETLRDMVGSAKVTGIESSYAYVVTNDGTMMYHPTEEKIGKPVENEVVKGLVAQIQDGKVPAAAVTDYLFNGEIKYASYYVSKIDGTPFILVISADESEVVAPVKSILTRAILFGLLIAIVIMVIEALLIRKSLRPVVMLDEIINRMSQLDVRQNETLDRLAKRSDEFGVMSKAIQGLQQQLDQTVVTIKGQSEKLFSSSDTMMKSATNMSETTSQVDQAVSDIAQGATSQADSTQKATDTVVRIGEMIEAATAAVAQLDTVSKQMTEAQNTASGILNDLDEINKQTTDAVDEIARQTDQTNESAAKIQEVTSLISSIAEETNLLSLNASIEAARAGEAGRGFAVVAEEIGKLAEQSNQSAKQIEDIIAQLVADSSRSVRTMETVREITSRQSEDIGKTNEAFGKITEGIAASNACVSNISNQMRDMDLARAEVVDTVENLSAIAEENAASTQESSASVTQINEIAGDIRESSGNLRDIAEVLRNNMNEFKN